VLELAPQGCVNVHYSLLPKYRGAAPIPWAILNGDALSGVSTIKLAEKMDAGPILLQEEIPLTAKETSRSLTSKMVPVGAQLLLATIRGLKDGSVVPKPQREQEANLAPMIKKEDGEIRWTHPAAAIERQVRAFDPWPSAYTHWRQKLVKIYRATVMTLEISGRPGEVIRADQGGFWIQTGEGVLSLEEVQLENRKRMAAAEFLRGARV
jgi:methionyl-tRNA formyltransferase